MTRLSSVFFALALGGLALGSSACKKPEYPACKKDKHCDAEAGETCVDGTCQNCTSDEDCAGKGPEGADWVCQEFRCADPAEAGQNASGNGEQGSPCTTTDECVGGLTCKAGVCDLCSEDLDCPTGACNLDSGRCSAEGECQSDDECPMDEICDGGMCIFSGDLGEGDTGLCGLDAVYFAFDSPKLTPATQESLQNAATCIGEQGREVYLEAHADGMGTEEYNIHLTEKRGNSVKKFLVDLGVPAEVMTVIAKGSMEARGHDEPSRAKDRRVAFIWK